MVERVCGNCRKFDPFKPGEGVCCAPSVLKLVTHEKTKACDEWQERFRQHTSLFPLADSQFIIGVCKEDGDEFLYDHTIIRDSAKELLRANDNFPKAHTLYLIDTKIGTCRDVTDEMAHEWCDIDYEMTAREIEDWVWGDKLYWLRDSSVYQGWIDDRRRSE